MNASGKRASRAPFAAASAAIRSTLSIVPVRSKATDSAWTHATLTDSSIRPNSTPLSSGTDDGDVVADVDRAVAEDVRVEPAAVHEALDHARLRHRLEVGARLAELDTLAFDVSDAEALADEVVHVDTAGDDVAARLARLDGDAVLALHRLDRFGRDQRDRSPGRGLAVVEVAVALEAAAGERPHG